MFLYCEERTVHVLNADNILIQDIVGIFFVFLIRIFDSRGPPLINLAFAN